MHDPPRHDALRAAAVAILMAGAVALSPAAAIAQAWSGQVTLYGWGPGVTGDFTPRAGAPTLEFDKSLSDVLEDLDGTVFEGAMTGPVIGATWRF